MAEKEKEGKFEKFMKIQNLFTLGLLSVAIVTASSTLAMAAAVDATAGVITNAEYQKWKKRKGKK